MTITKPLEQIIRSDVELLILSESEITNLRIAKGTIEAIGKTCYHIGPDKGTLDIMWNPGETMKAPKLLQLMTFHELGYTILVFDNKECYTIHDKAKTFPQNLDYQEVPRIKYLERCYQICHE